MWGTVGVKGSVLEKMKAVKEAGFDGAEMMSHMDQDEVLRARDATGLAIPERLRRAPLGQAAVAPRPEGARGRAGGPQADLARRQALRRFLGAAGARRW